MKILTRIVLIIAVLFVSNLFTQQDTNTNSNNKQQVANNDQIKIPYVKINNGTIFQGKIVRYDKDYAIVSVNGTEIPILKEMIVEIDGKKLSFQKVSENFQWIYFRTD